MMKKKKIIKKPVKKLKKHGMNEAELKVYLKALGETLEGIAAKVIADMKPYKCFIILQDEFGHGISSASGDFSAEEFSHYSAAILKKNNLKV